MSTKASVTKESAPKAAKTASSAPAPAKSSGAKTAKAAAPAKESLPAEKAKPVKSAVKEKPSVVTDAPAENEENIVKPEIIAEKAAVSPPVVQAPAAQEQKWEEIKAILEKLKEDTIREIRKSVKVGTEAVAAIEPGGDIYDQASSERDRELGLLLGDREREKIHSIDEALLRIADGDYGICEECDEDIPLGRLRAMPFTRHCVKCKSDLEKLQAQTKRVEEERAYREIPLGSEEDES
jgi:DnaK suppressor protein